MKYSLLLVLLVLFQYSCSKAQSPEPIYQKVLPKDGIMDASRIKPHKVKYKKTGGKMTYDLHLGNRQGKEAYELFIYFNSDESGTPDKIYFDLKTLGYLGRRLEMKAYTVDVSMDENGQFSGDLTPAKDSDYTPRAYDKTHPHGAFEPAVINYFISALPLKEGYKASIPCMDLNNGSEIHWANIEVVKKEMVKINGKSYETWKVESHGIRKKTIWVSTTEPYFIKMKTKGNPGTWKLDEVF